MSNKKTRYFVAIAGAILAIGLGTGLVASYMGLPVSVFSSAAGPDELQYVPADAAVVAYANVRDVMNSEFRQRFSRVSSRSRSNANEFEEKTGLNFEQDIDSVVAAVMPKDGMANNPARLGFLILARGRFEAAAARSPRASSMAAQVDRLPGQAPHHPSRQRATATDTTTWPFGFIEADLVAFGSIDRGQGADRRAAPRTATSSRTTT